MQINLNSAEMSFGGLYVHKGLGLGRGAYRFNNDMVEFIRPKLKQMAKDSNVDIHVKCRNVLHKGFDIAIGKVETSPIKRFLSYLSADKTKLRELDIIGVQNVPDLLLNTIEEAKDYFVNFREYLTQ